MDSAFGLILIVFIASGTTPSHCFWVIIAITRQGRNIPATIASDFSLTSPLKPLKLESLCLHTAIGGLDTVERHIHTINISISIANFSGTAEGSSWGRLKVISSRSSMTSYSYCSQKALQALQDLHSKVCPDYWGTYGQQMVPRYDPVPACHESTWRRPT